MSYRSIRHVLVSLHERDLPQLRLPICKICACAVLPCQARTYLRGSHHKLTSREATAVVNDLKTWPKLCESPAELELPGNGCEAIPFLPVYCDGLRCMLDSNQCNYVSRSIESLTGHWRVTHKWSAGKRRGGSGTQRRQKIAGRQAATMKTVCCQRLFFTKLHSNYFEVVPEATDLVEQAKQAKDETNTALDELRSPREERTKRGEIVTASGSVKEVSPLIYDSARIPSGISGHPTPFSRNFI